MDRYFLKVDWFPIFLSIYGNVVKTILFDALLSLFEK